MTSGSADKPASPLDTRVIDEQVAQFLTLWGQPQYDRDLDLRAAVREQLFC